LAATAPRRVAWGLRLLSLGLSLLKADLHLHTREAEPFIAYDARTLIDRAAREGFQVLSITNHDTLTFSEDLRDYARERGILLIPGVEATIEGRHVLLYNFDVHLSAIRTFDRLRRFKGPDWLVIAAHPFFPSTISLGRRLLDEIDVFDAIEFSHFYTRRIDFNRRAVALAREVGLPLLGSSDSHLARQFGTTYSLVESEPTVDCVLSAIRKGQVQIVSRPLSLGHMTLIAAQLGVSDVWERTRAAFHRRV
jgi:predicted metal-dependent phosphoesterase TrpH